MKTAHRETGAAKDPAVSIAQTGMRGTTARCALENKIMLVLSASVMVWAAVFQLIIVGLYVCRPILAEKADVAPVFIKKLVGIYYCLLHNSDIAAIALGLSAVCLLVSAAQVLMSFIQSDFISIGRLIFQKISCIYSLLLLPVFCLIDFPVVREGGVLLLLALGYIYYVGCVAHAFAIAFLFAAASKGRQKMRRS
ncbi:MAG TPA: hypothetical protein H9668_07475 [Firmicutes bacterium]|nr:hypothetical protein [Bacillota bacterium]